MQRILSGILIRSLFTWQIPADLCKLDVLSSCSARSDTGQLLRMTSPSFVVDQSLKMRSYKWPASFFIQSVCMCLSFELSVSPSPHELMWVRVLMRRDAWLTTAVCLSRPDETASSLALHAWCTSIPQNNTQTGLCCLTWPLVPLNRH